MQTKILLKQGLLVIACIGLVFLSAFLFYPVWRNFTQKDPTTLVENTAILQNQEKLASFGLPVRLRIPNINIDAAIEQVGVTSRGAMDVPKGPDGAAWFKLGPRPGERGSSVIAGHYGWKNGISAVFDNLHELQKGDKLYVEDQNGVVITFVVRESRRYNAKGNASDVFGSIDGKAHLNLITCEGVWNKVSESRPGRLVVFADRE